MAKILIIEDDKSNAELVSDWLRFEHHLVEAVHDGAEGLLRLKTCTYDLILLDWDLPKCTGLDVLKQFRDAGGQTPVLFLTAKGQIQDKEAGFETGADDYLTKPFHSRELLARVKALLRRPGEIKGSSMTVGELSLDATSYKVALAGQPVQLSPKEFSLLEFLMRYPDRTFSAEAILERVWHSESETTPDSVRVCVNRLRKKLNGQYVKSVFGAGYILESNGGS